MMFIGKGAKLLLGSMAIGAAVGLAMRRWRKRRAQRKAQKSYKTVVHFSVEPLIHTVEDRREELTGRNLFKRLCASLAASGYPPSEVGDTEEVHQCVLHVEGNPLFLTMKDEEGSRGEWTLFVSRSLDDSFEPGPQPLDSPAIRRFLTELGYAINGLEETRHVRWRSR